MTYPTLPIDARVGITKPFKLDPYITELTQGQVKEFISKHKRVIADSAISFSAYITNIEEVETILESLQGYKPFTLLQDNQPYICSEYTIEYKDEFKAEIQMTLTSYTS